MTGYLRHTAEAANLRSGPSGYPSGTRAIEYLPSIDGLRGIAILLVVWYHAPFLFSDGTRFPQEILLGNFQMIFWGLSLAGWIGVDLFFVVSGFLITSILLRSRDAGSSLQVFWCRRGLRILPLAVLYLSILQLNTVLHDPLGVLSHFDEWLVYLFYFGNVHIALHGWQPVVIMILWSLAVEEQFYIAWPVLVHWLSRKRLFVLSVVIIALSPLARGLVSYTYGYPAVYVFTLCRLDAIASGAVLALLINSQRWNAQTIIACRKLAPLAFFVLLTTFVVPLSPSFPQMRPQIFTLFGYTWIGIAFAVLVGASLRCEGWAWSLLNARVLTFVGKRCYGLYLWHALMAGLVKKLADTSFVPLGFYWQLSLWLFGLLVVASMSWSFFEQPILNLKRLVPYPVLLGRASATPTLS
jgi:peptidoglycan/LPS O-acetylase OafA/YrhL